jgi:predicted transcriptional regulator
MSPSPHTVLVSIVDRTEETGEPVTVRELATVVGASEAVLEGPIAALRECDLLETTAEGYRPTVTAHELLALDVDFEDVLVVDIVEE